jgi:type II secretory pathway predicted ATPase ExeA
MEMQQYLDHHLMLAGVEHSVFDETAVTAIHQGSGGLFRKANHLARGALIAASKSKSTMVSADHVRLAATEIF